MPARVFERRLVKSCLIYFLKRTRCKLKINKTCLHYSTTPTYKHTYILFTGHKCACVCFSHLPMLAADTGTLCVSTVLQVNEKSRISFFFNYDFKLKYSKPNAALKFKFVFIVYANGQTTFIYTTFLRPALSKCRNEINFLSSMTIRCAPLPLLLSKRNEYGNK